MLLNSFYKRLLRNEGVQEDKDDIFRNIYQQQRQKVSLTLRRRPEIQITLKTLFQEHLGALRLDKIGSIFSFLVKS